MCPLQADLSMGGNGVKGMSWTALARASAVAHWSPPAIILLRSQIVDCIASEGPRWPMCATHIAGCQTGVTARN